MNANLNLLSHPHPYPIPTRPRPSHQLGGEKIRARIPFLGTPYPVEGPERVEALSVPDILCLVGAILADCTCM